jgi:hypothetical protein
MFSNQQDFKDSQATCSADGKNPTDQKEIASTFLLM